MAAPLVIPEDFKPEAADKKTKCKTCTDFRFFKTAADLEVLRKGASFYGFLCSPGTSLGGVEKGMIESVINLSSFKAGDADFVPDINFSDPKDMGKYTYILNKAVYTLLDVTLDDISPELVASVPFQKACQPGACKVWTDCERSDTFRLTKTIIRAIYKVTIQFRVSWVPEEILESLAPLCDGLKVHKAIILERTKRDTTYVDSTYKVRSVLMYHSLKNGGLVVSNITCVANTSIPSVVARLVDNLGWAGAAEVHETAQKTRAHLELLKKKAKK